MNDPLNLKQYISSVNDFPIDGITFRDITSLIETPEVFNNLPRAYKDFTVF